GYVCLVNLRDYYSFITEDDVLSKSIFEPNVRDYQGKTPVNAQIQDSLRETKGEDFWWLNNGVTVLCSQASVSSKTLIVENPEIVNGLQTSVEIFKYFNETKHQSDDRNILVRVVVPEANSRDRII